MATTIRYENPYSQVFYHKSVNVSPEEHAQQKMAELRNTCVEVARMDPSVGSVQFNTVLGNAFGSQWTVQFFEENFNIQVHFDVAKKNKWTGGRTRNIGYTLSVKVIQECRPMAGNDGSLPPPRQILVPLK
ncbi:hypothetical protein VE00_05408 [Pseudogymnoascus sp. WSF 3629]|nr:hypothetical protein VE00_05408 [Pseudogymnoascus sp. WSF 3629]